MDVVGGVINEMTLARDSGYACTSEVHKQGMVLRVNGPTYVVDRSSEFWSTSRNCFENDEPCYGRSACVRMTPHIGM